MNTFIEASKRTLEMDLTMKEVTSRFLIVRNLTLAFHGFILQASPPAPRSVEGYRRISSSSENTQFGQASDVKHYSKAAAHIDPLNWVNLSRWVGVH